MTLKYVEFQLEDTPDVTPEEFTKMSAEAQMDLIRRTIRNAQKRTFVLAVAVVKYGRHDDTCDDPDTCTCAFTSLQEIAMDTIDALGESMGNDVTVN